MSSASSPFSPLSCCNSFLGVAIGNEFLDAAWGDFRASDWDIWHNRVPISLLVSVEQPHAIQPWSFALRQNYPNPFWSAATSRSAGNPETSIRYAITQPGKVKLSVYNRLGHKVVDLVDEYQTAGEYNLQWDGKNSRGTSVATGVYTYRLEIAGGARLVRKMTLLK